MPFLTQVSQLTLALLAIFSGAFLGGLQQMLKSLVVEKESHAGFLIPGLSTLMVILGCALAWLFYRYQWKEKFEKSFFGVALSRRLYIEDLYRLVFLKPAPYLKAFFLSLEKWVIDGIVNGVAWLANYFSLNVRRWQQGYIQFYLGLSFSGLILLIIIWWLR
jgi:NADH-quinone oxidoreductase subunit L